MARPQSIPTDQLLKSAMAQFWQHGYLATSLQDLQRISGLPASSLYNRFGSKAQLFEAVLEQYVQKVVKGRCDKYLMAGTGLEGIQQYVASALNDPNAHWGCLLVNSQAQLEHIPEAAIALIREAGQLVCGALRQALEDAEAKEEIASGQNLSLLCEQLALFIQGLLLQSTLPHSRPKEQKVALMLAQQLRANNFSGDVS
ncbi:TetR/AcrR family transcriptional regulator [Pseudoteredinibacter isoporae]|uniref:TetR/AcrR family transcriptional repressor of nem operon n=1 Tax=Pseudoteredinibacter isoporae TaxID=570281 RepID=A0A7X0JSA2_9GAMM|nr:TetR/AcrR family transcriptional regulator [Pseudoteredinibacter isoporae]MBB6520421.1 TetR/AcrR family transcriptional repressor of nem operon [Pseudoteredinibacter isoporae]NHO85989.1 TetR/AcrR family transcriptional regulator [Pseudoteredinibacter isoporae]